jgi:peroxiredoxin
MSHVSATGETPRPRRVTVGMTAPDFTLPDALTGRDTRLSDFHGKDVLLVFFRGTWCPFCREQMRLLAENHDRLFAAGIAVLGVLCQNRGTVRRHLEKEPLPFPLLPDESRRVAREYGVHYWLTYEGFNLAHPSLFILDRQGRVAFAHVGKNMADLPVGTILNKFLQFLGDGK